MSFGNTQHFLLEGCRDHSAGKGEKGKWDIQRNEETVKLELEEVSKHIPNEAFFVQV